MVSVRQLLGMEQSPYRPKGFLNVDEVVHWGTTAFVAKEDPCMAAVLESMSVPEPGSYEIVKASGRAKKIKLDLKPGTIPSLARMLASPEEHYPLNIETAVSENGLTRLSITDTDVTVALSTLVFEYLREQFPDSAFSLKKSPFLFLVYSAAPDAVVAPAGTFWIGDREHSIQTEFPTDLTPTRYAPL